MPGLNGRRLKSLASAFILLSLLVALLAAAGFALSEQGRVFAVRAIPLEWRERLNNGRMEVEIARDVEAGIGLRFADVMGKRPWEIDLKALGQSINQMPWIEEAQIQRVLPDRLVVSILPRRPLAVIVPTIERKSESRLSLRPIAADGRLMPEWNSAVVPDVPFLRGDRFLRDPALREQAVALIRALPAQGVLSRSNLAEIGWVDGFTLLLLSPRTEIRLGADDIDAKLRRVTQVLNYLSSQGKKAPVIDATSVKKVVVRAQHRP